MPARESYPRPHGAARAEARQPAPADLEAAWTQLVALCHLPGAAGIANRNILRAFATKRAQPTSSGLYVELSPAYIAAMTREPGHVSRSTAAPLLARIIAILGIRELSYIETRALGIRLRQRAPGQKWGRHLLVTKAIRRICRRALVADDLGELDTRGWDPLPRPHDPDRARPGHREDGGRPAPTRCPYHDDDEPSASSWVNQDRETGGGVCHACQGEDGARLTWALRRAPDGAWWARRAGAPVEPRQPSPIPRNSPLDWVGTTAIDTLEGGWGADPPGTWSYPAGEPARETPTSILRATPWGRSLGGHRAAAGDLLEVLARADALSSTQAAESAALTAMARAEGRGERPDIPDRLVYGATMEPVWTEGARGTEPYWYVGGWTPRELRWILVDLDPKDRASSFSAADVAGLVDRARRVAGGADLTGRFAVVQTSPGGAQVWLELARIPTGDLDGWRRSPGVAAWYARIAVDLAGGLAVKIDHAASRATQAGRRPGWRVLRQGGVWRARLVGASGNAPSHRLPLPP